MITAIEFWAIPKGAALSASVKSIKSNPMQSESVGTKDSSMESVRNYRAAVQEPITVLRTRPRTVGIV